PHPPAGTFSPYSDGEKGALSAPFEVGENFGASSFLSVSIRGEMPGRAMRDSAIAMIMFATICLTAP
ncbi:hypothetical protein, partial [Mesorhizobium sp.]|uniref:hypothetical protein n=1 Tax=Mesorhizobium sp. TaxID=1871066 RepID=UPI001223948E